ncbi:hypothetical protein TgHK011_006827 [Trichoderma gracile]|nr:hypothetical protein TgHK011_006827 [Trichoderma gracile]
MGLDPNSQPKAGRKPSRRNNHNRPGQKKQTEKATNNNNKSSSAPGNPNRRRATLPRQPYVQEIYYNPSQNAHFETPESWEGRHAKLVKNTKRVYFPEKFPIKDAHIDALIEAGTDVCHSLRSFSAGDAETGQGRELTDAAIVRLAQACPNLVHVSLDGAVQLTDKSLLSLFTNCPNLVFVQVSGDDNSPGRVKGTALRKLKDSPAMAPKLIELKLSDQCEIDERLEAAMKALSAARRDLLIQADNTHEEYGSVHYWLGGKNKFEYELFGGASGMEFGRW